MQLPNSSVIKCWEITDLRDTTGEYCTVEDLLAGLGGIPHRSKSSLSNWIRDGKAAEVLIPGGSWKKGKVRLTVTVDFTPDDEQPPA